MNRIVLAYSGGLSSSAAIPWLAEERRAEVVAVTMDFGQGGELEDVRERALANGAVRAHVLDLRDALARDVILPALQAGALGGGRDACVAGLAHPLLARHLAEIAAIEGTTVVAHGALDEHLGRCIRSFAPALTVLEPAREWEMTRADALDFAKARGLQVPGASDAPYAVDRNLAGRTIEGGALADPGQEPPEDIYTLTKASAEAPDAAAVVEIAFERGVPVKINDIAMPLVDVIQCLETIAGEHGVGRTDNAIVGPDAVTRRIVEAPALAVLDTAHRELQALMTPAELAPVTSQAATTYADLLLRGGWYSQTREAIDALVAQVQTNVTGTVKLKLFKGSCAIRGRRSKKPRASTAKLPITQ
jgi:argininosuccinate synthase